MISPEEMKVLDLNSAYLGMPNLKLMENAGQVVAKNLMKEFKKASKVAILCGRGNNGGDGFVAARYLAAEGIDVHIFLAEPDGDPSTEIARLNLQKVRDHVRPKGNFKPKDFDVIIDALLGVGIKGKVREPYSSLIRKINQSKAPILSVDVPSGCPSSPAVKPKITVTFHAAKEGIARNCYGKLVVADIGIPEEAEIYVGPGDFIYLPRPKPGSHKGDNGRVLVVGGGPFTGAPALAGMAAMYAGADLAHIAVPGPAAVPVACYSPNLIVHPLIDKVIVSEDLDVIQKLMKKCDVAVIGPGLGDDSKAQDAVAEIIHKCTLPMVIDAEALNAVKKNPKIIARKKVILTPHRGEFQKLTGVRLAEDPEKRKDQVYQAAKKLGVTLLVKGPIDVISDGKDSRLNRTGNDAMTVGGTGDVLAGISGALLAKGVGTFHAAQLAAFINGVAGEIAFQEMSYGLLATDVAGKIPYVLRRYV